MKKIIILILCSSFLLNDCYGQYSSTPPPNNSAATTDIFLYGLIGAGAIYYLIKNAKHNSNSSPREYKPKSHIKENIKNYKNQVEAISENMKTINNGSLQIIDIREKLLSAKTFYESSANEDNSFIEKASKYKAQYNELSTQYGKYINQKFYPEFESEKKSFNSNLKSNIPEAKNNLTKLNQLKQTLCWNESENLQIATDIDNFNYIIEVWDKFQNKYSDLKNSLSYKTVSSSEADNEIKDLIKQQQIWQGQVGNNNEMQSKIEELKSQVNELKAQNEAINCQHYKTLYESLKVQCEQIEKTEWPKKDFPEFSQAFSSTVTDFYTSLDTSNNNCVGVEKFKSLYKRVAAKNDEINRKLISEMLYETSLEEKKKDEYVKSHPLSFNSFSLYPDVIGEYVMRLYVHNNTEKEIDAFRCIIKYYNKFGEPVNFLFSDSNTGEITSQRILGADEDGIVDFSLIFQEQTRKIRVTLTKVLFTDGTTWIPKKGQFSMTDVPPLQ